MTTEPRKPRRSAATWLLLIVVWTIGLTSWTVYITAAAFVLLRVLG